MAEHYFAAVRAPSRTPRGAASVDRDCGPRPTTPRPTRAPSPPCRARLPADRAGSAQAPMAW